MPVFTRRTALALIGAAAAGPAFADDYIDLDWRDLLPEGQPYVPGGIRELFLHDETAAPGEQPPSTGVRTDWNGMIVRIPGYVVPIEFDGTALTAFLLVPFVGACVHVPPPPANQLIFVTTPEPYESKGLFEPVNVIGMFGTASMSTQLAEIGYALSADRIEPYS